VGSRALVYDVSSVWSVQSVQFVARATNLVGLWLTSPPEGR
jgi:hypothetical protein